MFRALKAGVRYPNSDYNFLDLIKGDLVARTVIELGGFG